MGGAHGPGAWGKGRSRNPGGHRHVCYLTPVSQVLDPEVLLGWPWAHHLSPGLSWGAVPLTLLSPEPTASFAAFARPPGAHACPSPRRAAMESAFPRVASQSPTQPFPRGRVRGPPGGAERPLRTLPALCGLLRLPPHRARQPTWASDSLAQHPAQQPRPAQAGSPRPLAPSPGPVPHLQPQEGREQLRHRGGARLGWGQRDSLTSVS